MQIKPTYPRASRRYVRVLTIAGSDSSGGAGIQADLKTMSALGCYGMTAITAITAQNTVGVSAVHVLPADLLQSQIQAVVEDIGVDAVKIGMLPSVEQIEVVARAIEHYKFPWVVLDPVMVSSSGTALMGRNSMAAMVATLFPQVSLVTPNLDEASLLLGRSVARTEEMDNAASALLALGAKAVLLKGGHLPGDQMMDVLAQSGLGLARWQSQRIVSANLHGTGCTLASAIASYLALGYSLAQAVSLARDYLMQAIVSGAEVQTGQGQGPLNHGHSPVALCLRPADPAAQDEPG